MRISMRTSRICNQFRLNRDKQFERWKLSSTDRTFEQNAQTQILLLDGALLFELRIAR
jgi:hypothetical protein